MKYSYDCTMRACFTGYIVQAIVNNFVPLLFLTFQRTYHIPLQQITLLVTFNFGIQLLTDLLSVAFVDRMGYRASMVLAHILSALGLICLTVLPEWMGHPFAGILISVIVYAVGNISELLTDSYSVTYLLPVPAARQGALLPVFSAFSPVFSFPAIP